MSRPRTPPELVEAMLERRRQKKREYDRYVPINDVAQELLHDAGTIKAPDFVVAERDRRLSLPRSLSVDLLGDPVVPRWNSNARPSERGRISIAPC